MKTIQEVKEYLLKESEEKGRFRLHAIYGLNDGTMQQAPLLDKYCKDKGFELIGSLWMKKGEEQVEIIIVYKRDEKQTIEEAMEESTKYIKDNLRDLYHLFALARCGSKVEFGSDDFGSSKVYRVRDSALYIDSDLKENYLKQ